MIWPLFEQKPNLPTEGSVGSFAHKRSYYYHPGVDLYCGEGQEIVAVEDGIVVNVEIFTGPSADPTSPWWNETWGVLVEGASGVLGYCELKPMFYIKQGLKLKSGDLIGHVIPVLKRDKGNGTTMLHFELYLKGTRTHMTWHHDEPQPVEMCDPTELLRKVANES